jgi:NAD(P)H-hydrate epimerase
VIRRSGRLRGDPAGTTAELITWANDQAAPVVALDTPSGLDPTTGAAGTPAVWATATLTLALPKVGLFNAPSVGELYLADISVPSLVYQRMGIAVPELFRHSSLLRIEPWQPSDAVVQGG